MPSHQPPGPHPEANMDLLHPGRPHAEQMASLSRLWAEQGPETALALVAAAAQAAPQDRALHLAWLEALLRLRRLDEAGMLAARLDHFDASGRLRLINQAVIAEQAGDYQTAVALLLQAETIQPSLHQQMRLINLAAELGDAALGLRWSQAARRLAQNPQDRLLLACTEVNWRFNARDFTGTMQLALLTVQGLLDSGSLLADAAPAAQPAGGDPAHDDKLRQTLIAALQRLETAGLQPFAIAGLLLGWQRDAAFLPNDKDIDLALPPGLLPAEAVLAEAAAALCNDGRFRLLPNMLGMLDFNTFADTATGIHVDLVAHRQDTSGGILGGSRMAGLPDAECRLLRHAAYDLVRAEWQGVTLWRPADADRLLCEYYGNWRQRDPHFNSMISAPAMLGFPDFVRAMAYLHLVLAVQAGRREAAIALAQQICQRDAGDVLADWFLHQIEATA